MSLCKSYKVGTFWIRAEQGGGEGGGDGLWDENDFKTD